MATRTRSELLASFADNTSGDITPEDLRDFVDSVSTTVEADASYADAEALQELQTEVETKATQTAVDALNAELDTLTTTVAGKANTSHVHSGSDITSGTVADARLSAQAQSAINASHAAVTIGTANGLTLSTQAISLAAATTSAAGAMSAADKTKLDGIASGATANATDAQLRDRTTHTGTQAISTVTGLQSALDDKATSAALEGYLPLTGGSLTGEIDLTGHNLLGADTISANSINILSSGGNIDVNEAAISNVAGMDVGQLYIAAHVAGDGGATFNVSDVGIMTFAEGGEIQGAPNINCNGLTVYGSIAASVDSSFNILGVETIYTNHIGYGSGGDPIIDIAESVTFHRGIDMYGSGIVGLYGLQGYEGAAVKFPTGIDFDNVSGIVNSTSISTNTLNMFDIQFWVDGGNQLNVYAEGGINLNGGNVSNATNIACTLVEANEANIHHLYAVEDLWGFDAPINVHSALMLNDNTLNDVQGIYLNGNGGISGAYQIYLEQTLNINQSGGQIRMKSPDGTEYEITVANGGTLTVTAV